ncbi:OPT family oligopeptide transporter [Novosphingobium sp. MMS21-SN21R]|uniref:OPT family oligopeptide transporter n=1 Tax=Novosphingobium sp. MMS21-SN21R TaxID=2969298 RepID=UPI0028877678|nr:oligopeptide transporter, OPT family [Novosphingobium sp. MMS21-SN21R]MDT0508053.1 oligopeptide transporter, OPT family [Novosphingobium sp. MMS21-SN21R]
MTGTASPRELTVRGVILGALLTVVFTAANVYLGLRIGLTFATSIPAAVISMAVLRAFSGTTIQENNIVQTIASSAGTLSAIVFVLPGLVMVGWWADFPYWESVAVIAVGGILGVMYSVPLRRALVTGSDLPYPEGVAAAEVLKVGAGVGGEEENRKGLAAVTAGGLLAAFYPLLAKMKLAAEEVGGVFKVGTGGSMLFGGLSLALVGVGHLVGIAVGLAMLVGIIISFGFLLPQFTAGGPPVGTEFADFVGTVFRQKIRFIGAGTIGVAAIWTLLRVIGPIVRGVTAALAANKARKGQGIESLALTERDLPIGIVGGTILLSMIPIALLLADFAVGGPVAGALGMTLIASVIYVLVAGIVIASVCGYMAGLIGASNSPISGVGILAALGISLLLLALFGQGGSEEDTKALVAFALFVTAIVFGVATISNDNLQDLKTGQLVGATPWRQQIALVLGVIFGALVIPPILDLLNSTFGFQGAPGAGENALSAPQAALISAIAQGVLGGSLDWNLVGLGAAIGAGVVLVDELLKRTGRGSLPPLAVGMGMYLPTQVTMLVIVGAVLGHLYNRWASRQSAPDLAERMGVLTATGLIVGDSLFNIAYAAIVAATDNPDALAVVDGFGASLPLGVAVFGGIVAYAYWRMRRDGKSA